MVGPDDVAGHGVVHASPVPHAEPNDPACRYVAEDNKADPGDFYRQEFAGGVPAFPKTNDLASFGGRLNGFRANRAVGSGVRRTRRLRPPSARRTEPC
jgi:hypothetical protein